MKRMASIALCSLVLCASLTACGMGRVDLTAHSQKGFLDDFFGIAAVSIGDVTYPLA